MSAIRKSARGEQCSVRIPTICGGDPETVVWAHANGSAAGKGIGMKSPDLLGAYCCGPCHDVVDHRATSPFNRAEIKAMFADGHYRSLRILIEKGLVTCP